MSIDIVETCPDGGSTYLLKYPVEAITFSPPPIIDNVMVLRICCVIASTQIDILLTIIVIPIGVIGGHIGILLIVVYSANPISVHICFWINIEYWSPESIGIALGCFEIEPLKV